MMALFWLMNRVPPVGTMVAADHMIFLSISFIWVVGYINAFNFPMGWH